MSRVYLCYFMQIAMLIFISFCSMASTNWLVAQQAPKKLRAKTGQPDNLVTFNQNVAPIIHQKCASCHRPGQAGPFSLLTYKDVSRRARTIEAVIDSGYMPPWKPVNHNVRFTNDRRLSQQEQEIIKRWIQAGKPKGKGPAPSPPEFQDGWSLGQPDLIIQMNGEFEVPASGNDIYRSFVFPLQLEQDRWVKAIEYRPTATSSVHHALFFADTTGSARSMDGQDGKPGIAGMSFLIGGTNSKQQDTERQDTAQAPSLFTRLAQFQSGKFEPPVTKALGNRLGGYVPGAMPAFLPSDLAMKLPAQSDIVLQTHFHPSGKVELEKGKIGIYFTDKEPSQKLVQIQVPAVFGFGKGIRIPAGQTDYTVEESYTTPTDIKLISVGAHAHYICREASMIAQLPDGQKTVLLKIDDWDLDWQDRYYFRDSPVLPAGTIITTKLTYDNSADNPENPNSPPQEIRWGRESGDEMGSAMLLAVAADESKRPELERSIRRYTVSSIMQGDMVELLMQLDTNRDGGLQPDEAPARMQQRFSMLDSNRDGKLAPEELEFIRQFVPAKE